MKIQINDAERLVKDALKKLGYNDVDSDRISHHLIDSELRGYGAAGLARVLSIADHLAGRTPKSATTITREAPATAQIDGQDTLGYLVAYEATALAIQKAKQTGVACVGVNGTWYTGMLSYYAEMAAKEDLVATIASSCSVWVAPEGGYKPMFGTNPYCIGFPSSDVPVIYDIGTSKVLHADVKLAHRLGRDLPADSVIDGDGKDTTDPSRILDGGAIKVWGGFRGSGLAMSVQLMGVVAGAPALPPDLEDFGFLIIVVNPAMFRPIDEFKKEIDEYAKEFRAQPPVEGGSALRMPFERSNQVRDRNRAAGEFEVEEGVVERLKDLINS